MAFEAYIDAANTTPGGTQKSSYMPLDLEDLAAKSGGRKERLRMDDPQHARFAARSGNATTVQFPEFERAHIGSANRDIPNAQNTAAQILADAREAAREMLAQAKASIANERKTVIEAARKEGHAQGIAQADTEMAGLIGTCEQIGLHLATERDNVLANNEREIVELALSIADRIVGAALEVSPELVVEACEGAMRKAFHRGTMTVLANPEDLELLRAAGPRMSERLGGVDHLEFVSERRLDRGSVIVRTNAGEIDGTIEGKRAKIEQVLREGIAANMDDAEHHVSGDGVEPSQAHE